MDYVIVWCQKFNSDDLLLVLKDKPKWQEGRLNLPGGKVENGESALNAATRELKEETGYEPAVPVRLMGKMQDGPNKIYCVKAVIIGKDPPAPRKEETQEISWYRWHAAMSDNRLIPNLRVIIPLMKCGVTNWLIGDTYRGHDKPNHTIRISVPNVIKDT